MHPDNLIFADILSKKPMPVEHRLLEQTNFKSDLFRKFMCQRCGLEFLQSKKDNLFLFFRSDSKDFWIDIESLECIPGCFDFNFYFIIKNDR